MHVHVLLFFSRRRSKRVFWLWWKNEIWNWFLCAEGPKGNGIHSVHNLRMDTTGLRPLSFHGTHFLYGRAYLFLINCLLFVEWKDTQTCPDYWCSATFSDPLLPLPWRFCWWNLFEKTGIRCRRNDAPCLYFLFYMWAGRVILFCNNLCLGVFQNGRNSRERAADWSLVEWRRIVYLTRNYSNARSCGGQLRVTELLSAPTFILPRLLFSIVRQGRWPGGMVHGVVCTVSIQSVHSTLRQPQFPLWSFEHLFIGCLRKFDNLLLVDRKNSKNQLGHALNEVNLGIHF